MPLGLDVLYGPYHIAMNSLLLLKSGNHGMDDSARYQREMNQSPMGLRVGLS